MSEQLSRSECLAAAGAAAPAALKMPHPLRPLPVPPPRRWARKPAAPARANGARAVEQAHDLLIAGADRDTRRRVEKRTDARQPDGRVQPRDGLTSSAMHQRAELGAVSLCPGRCAVHDGAGAQLVDTAPLSERPAASC